MNRLTTPGAPWPTHKVKARGQRRRRESHGRTQYREVLDAPTPDQPLARKDQHQ